MASRRLFAVALATLLPALLASAGRGAAGDPASARATSPQALGRAAARHPIEFRGLRGSAILAGPTGATATVPVTSPAVGEDTLVLVLGMRGHDAALTRIEDASGNRWQIDSRASSKAENGVVEVASSRLVSPLRAGDELVLHFSPAPADVRLGFLAEFSGIAAGQPVQQQTTALGGGDAMLVSSAEPVEQSDELAVSAFVSDAAGWARDAAFAPLTERPLRSSGAVSDKTLFTQYRLGSSFDPIVATGTLRSSSSWVGALVLYRAERSVGDDVPPGTPTALHATPADGPGVRLSWLNPPDPDFDHAEVFARAQASAGAWQAVARTPSRADDLNPPFAAGDASWNIRLNEAGKEVVLRFVPRVSKTLAHLYLHVKTSGSGYAGGTGGIALASLHPVAANGLPDARVVIGSELRVPVTANPAGPYLLRLDFGVPLRAGVPYALVVRNGDPDPARNYWSLNFLAVDTGPTPALAGAQSRNETAAGARDLFYGLDPREAVGGTSDGGKLWRLPGNTDVSEAKWVPTYALVWSDRSVQAQPYYSSHAPPDGTYTMVYRHVRSPWTIRQIGAYLHTWGASVARRGSGVVEVLVDNVPRASVRLAGSGFVSAWLPHPVTVRPGQTVELRVPVAAAGGAAGLPLRYSYADAQMAAIVGLGRRSDFYLDVPPYTYALPVFPLPYQGHAGAGAQTTVRVPAAGAYAVAAYDSAGNRSPARVVTAPRGIVAAQQQARRKTTAAGHRSDRTKTSTR
jgi:hypothetical protein